MEIGSILVAARIEPEEVTLELEPHVEAKVSNLKEFEEVMIHPCHPEQKV